MTQKQMAAQEIEQHLETLVEETLNRVYLADPKMEQRYGSIGRRRCKEDIVLHYCTLTEALSTGDQGIFDRYIGWSKIVLQSRKIPINDLALTMRHMKESSWQRLTLASASTVNKMIDRAVRKLPNMPAHVPSYVPDDAPLSSHTNRYISGLLSANRDESRKIIRGLIQGGVRMEDIFIHIFERSQREIGRLWQENQISVAREHYATATTELYMAEIKGPEPARRLRRSFVGTCAIGESHSLGIRMMSELLDKQGWRVYYTGANTPIAGIVDLFGQFPIHVLGVSAATAMQLSNVRKLIDALRGNKRSRHVKILVGGKIFNDSPNLWKSVGADGYAPNAIKGVVLANKLVKDGSRVTKRGTPKRRAGTKGKKPSGVRK